MNGFVFDMDGCLLDSIRIWHEAEQRVLDLAHIELTKEERDKLNTLTLEEAATWFHERFGILGSGKEVARVIVDYMLHFYNTRVQANPGVLVFVQALYDAGAPLCVLSSSPQSFLQAGLSHTGLKRFFSEDRIISAEDRGWAKRDPHTFECVCEMLGTAPENTWLFDDSWYALATAQGAGLCTVGVFSADGCGTHEELARYSTIVVDDFTELNLADFI